MSIYGSKTHYLTIIHTLMQIVCSAACTAARTCDLYIRCSRAFVVYTAAAAPVGNSRLAESIQHYYEGRLKLKFPEKCICKFCLRI